MPALIENAFICDYVTVSTTSCVEAIPDFVILGSTFTNQATFLTALGNAFVSNDWALSYTIDNNTITIVWDTEFFKDADCCDFVITVTPARITGPPCNDPTQTNIPYLYLEVSSEGEATDCCKIEISGGTPGCCFVPTDLYQLRHKMEKWYMSYMNEKILKQFKYLGVGKTSEPNDKLREYNDVLYLMLLIYLQKTKQRCNESTDSIFSDSTIQCIKDHFLCLGIDVSCLFEMAEIGNLNNCCNEIPIDITCPCVDEVPKNLPTQYLTLDKNVEYEPIEYSTPIEYKCCSGDETFTVTGYTNSLNLPVTLNFASYTQTTSLDFTVTFDNQAATEGQKGDIVISMDVCGKEVQQLIKIDIIDTCENEYPASLPLITQTFDINDQTIEDYVFATTITYDCCNEEESLRILQVSPINNNLGLEYTGPIINDIIAGNSVTYTFIFDAFNAVPNTVGDYWVKLKLCNDREITQRFRFTVINTCVIDTSSLDNISVDIDVDAQNNTVVQVPITVPNDIECCDFAVKNCIKLLTLVSSRPLNIYVQGGLDTVSTYCEGDTFYIPMVVSFSAQTLQSLPNNFTATATVTALVCGIQKQFTITFNFCKNINLTAIGLSPIQVTLDTVSPIEGSFTLSNFNCCGEEVNSVEVVNIVNVPDIFTVTSPIIGATFGPNDTINYSITYVAPELESGTYPYEVILVFDSCGQFIEIPIVLSINVDNETASCDIPAEGGVGGSVITHTRDTTDYLIVPYDCYNFPDPITIFNGVVTTQQINNAYTTLATQYLNTGIDPTASGLTFPVLASNRGNNIWARTTGVLNFSKIKPPANGYTNYSGVIVAGSANPQVTIQADSSNWWYKLACNSSVNDCGDTVNYDVVSHPTYNSEGAIVGYIATQAFLFRSTGNILHLDIDITIGAGMTRGYKIDMIAVSQGTTNIYRNYYDTGNTPYLGTGIAMPAGYSKVNSTAIKEHASDPGAWQGTSPNDTVSAGWALSAGSYTMEVATIPNDIVVCIISCYGDVNSTTSGTPSSINPDFNLADNVTITSSCLTVEPELLPAGTILGELAECYVELSIVPPVGIDGYQLFDTELTSGLFTEAVLSDFVFRAYPIANCIEINIDYGLGQWSGGGYVGDPSETIPPGDQRIPTLDIMFYPDGLLTPGTGILLDSISLPFLDVTEMPNIQNLTTTVSIPSVPYNVTNAVIAFKFVTTDPGTSYAYLQRVEMVTLASPC